MVAVYSMNCRFPGESLWKAKWIKALRGNRNDANWMPSKFSVVCSLHFEECDINSTKCGLRRVVKNAIPRKVRWSTLYLLLLYIH